MCVSMCMSACGGGGSRLGGPLSWRAQGVSVSMCGGRGEQARGVQGRCVRGGGEVRRGGGQEEKGGGIEPTQSEVPSPPAPLFAPWPWVPVATRRRVMAHLWVPLGDGRSSHTPLTSRHAWRGGRGGWGGVKGLSPIRLSGHEPPPPPHM